MSKTVEKSQQMIKHIGQVDKVIWTIKYRSVLFLDKDRLNYKQQ